MNIRPSKAIILSSAVYHLKILMNLIKRDGNMVESVEKLMKPV